MDINEKARALIRRLLAVIEVDISPEDVPLVAIPGGYELILAFADDVRREALDGASRAESPDKEEIERNFEGRDIRMWQRGFDAKDDTVRALIDTPPPTDRASAANASGVLRYIASHGVRDDADREALERVRGVLHRLAGLPPLDTPPSDAPDPRVALAKFFKVQWDDANCISAAERFGLIGSDSAGFDYELTDLGKAALRLAEGK